MGDEIKVVCVEVVQERRQTCGPSGTVGVWHYRAKFLRGHDAADGASSYPEGELTVLTTQKGRYRVGRTYVLGLSEAATAEKSEPVAVPRIP